MLRKVIVWGIVSVLMVGLVAIAETNVPETPEANVGGTLTVGLQSTLSSLDPRLVNDTYGQHVRNAIFDGLLTVGPDLQVRPYVAKSWEIFEGHTIFYLNEGITFHNGEELTAEDVAFTLNWIVNPENNSMLQWIFRWLKEVVVVDDYTVDFINEPEFTPYMPQFVTLTMGFASIVPKDTVLEMGNEAFNLHPIGSGPYKFVEWKSGDHITLERNEEYWLTYPNLDRVIFRIIPEASVMMLALESGEIDVSDTVTTQDISRLRKNPEIEILQSPSLRYVMLEFNMTTSPSDDIRYRKAVYMSVDVDAAVKAVYGDTAIRAYGTTPPILWSNDVEYLRDYVALEENDEEAKRIFAGLKAEGVIPEDFKTEIITPNDTCRRQLATIFATNLQQNGIDAEVRVLEWGPILQLLGRSDADPTLKDVHQVVFSGGGDGDPHNMPYFQFHSDNASLGSSNNFTWYRNPAVDTLIDKADTSTDQEVRRLCYVHAVRIALQDYVHVPLAFLTITQGVRARVHGFTVNPDGAIGLCGPYMNVWVEKQ